MTAVALYDEALDHLRRRDDVSLSEAIKAEAVANSRLLAERIETAPEGDAGAQAEQVGRFLTEHDDANEQFLAVAFPALEYGGAELHGVVARASAHIIEPALERGGGSALRRASAVVVGGRLLWALCAYALACDRTDALAAVGTIAVPPATEEGTALSALVWADFRYPDALGGNAGHSYDHYHDWLGARTLVEERLPLFASDFDDVFSEADLLLALVMIASGRSRAYSGGARTPIIRRLARRFVDKRQRLGLCDLFGADDEELDEVVETAYRQHLEYDRGRFWGGIPSTFIVRENASG